MERFPRVILYRIELPKGGITQDYVPLGNITQGKITKGKITQG